MNSVWRPINKAAGRPGVSCWRSPPLPLRNDTTCSSSKIDHQRIGESWNCQGLGILVSRRHKHCPTTLVMPLLPCNTLPSSMLIGKQQSHTVQNVAEFWVVAVLL